MLDDVIRDLADEQAALDVLVGALPADVWETPTPSPGWAIRDHVIHLGHFDRMAAMAVADPRAFADDVVTAMQGVAAYEARYLDRGRELPPPALLAWWRDARATLLDTARSLDDRARVPWYGPPMSAASFLTARLMECWLHGHDVADALGVAREETDRVRHIVFLGVRTRTFSYAVRGLPPRTEAVRLDLLLPSGVPWTDGEEGAVNRITGAAVDFCRVVTHRRHVTDTALRVEGDAARDWMRVAQAFAGPPAPGRAPGQFRPSPADVR